MSDTIKTQAQLQSDFADNTSGAITPQKLRNFVVSVLYHNDSNVTTLPGDLNLNNHDITNVNTINGVKTIGVVSDGSGNGSISGIDGAGLNIYGTIFNYGSIGLANNSTLQNVTSSTGIATDGDGKISYTGQSSVLVSSSATDFQVLKANGDPAIGTFVTDDDAGSILTTSKINLRDLGTLFSVSLLSPTLASSITVTMPGIAGTLLVDTGFTMSGVIDMNGHALPNVDGLSLINIIANKTANLFFAGSSNVNVEIQNQSGTLALLVDAVQLLDYAGYKTSGVQVVGAQQPAIADVSGTSLILLSDVILVLDEMRTKFNTLLAEIRPAGHGLIAT